MHLKSVETGARITAQLSAIDIQRQNIKLAGGPIVLYIDQ